MTIENTGSTFNVWFPFMHKTKYYVSKSNTHLIHKANFYVDFFLIFFHPKDHSQFVNCIRFSPDGSRFVTAGADGQVSVRYHVKLKIKMTKMQNVYLIVFIKYPQILIYDGTTGERVGSLGGEKAHKGGIYAVSLF